MRRTVRRASGSSSSLSVISFCDASLNGPFNIARQTGDAIHSVFLETRSLCSPTTKVRSLSTHRSIGDGGIEDGGTAGVGKGAPSAAVIMSKTEAGEFLAGGEEVMGMNAKLLLLAANLRLVPDSQYT